MQSCSSPFTCMFYASTFDFRCRLVSILWFMNQLHGTEWYIFISKYGCLQMVIHRSEISSWAREISRHMVWQPDVCLPLFARGCDWVNNTVYWLQIVGTSGCAFVTATHVYWRGCYEGLWLLWRGWGTSLTVCHHTSRHRGAWACLQALPLSVSSRLVRLSFQT